jgi:hypothetical protein
MASWSRQRRFTYAALVMILLVGTVVGTFLLFFYEAPSCFDGILNGKEQGIDCGGSCVRLCASSFGSPRLAWTRFEELVPGFYNIAAYITNPNPKGQARGVPYHFMVYDARGILIIEHKGKVDIPPQRNTLVFARAVDVGKRIPAKASFEFTGAPDWRSAVDTLDSLVIGEKKYTEDTTSSSLEVSIRNSSVSRATGPFAVYVILYDIDNNAIGFSKTLIDDIQPGQNVIAPFTWPFDRDGKVISIEVLPVAE